MRTFRRHGPRRMKLMEINPRRKYVFGEEMAHMTDMEKFAEMLKTHNRIVFFGGAGVSTESNIPDFRGKNGLYNQKTDLPWSPEEMLSHHFWAEHPVEFYTLYKEREGMMMSVEPNRAHYALAELEQMGKLHAVVTQNIDGLHQKAGSKNVLELHGSVLRNICLKCHKTYGMQEFLDLCNPIPHCPDCGGVVKPDVVLYEESLDYNTITESIDEIQHADMLIIGGTSLVVQPAASFTHEFRGDALVLINMDATPMDSRCDLVFRESVGAVLEEGLKRLKEMA